MKKLLITFLVILFLFIIATFVFIPSKITLTESRVVATTSGGFDSCLHNLEKWKQWWPGNSSSTSDSFFLFNNCVFKLSEAFTDGGRVQIGFKDWSSFSRIQLITKSRDSITATWSVVLTTGKNPLTRIANYLNKDVIKKSLQVVMDSLCNYAGRTENVYGFPIERTTFPEIYLIAYRFKSTNRPGTGLIYTGINKLRQYIKSKDGTERFYPMINTKQIDSSHYETMIAISVQNSIPASGDFFISQMVPMKDRFLSTEVNGGQEKLDQAHKAVEKYMEDHSLSAPARPFEILVTDRSKEPDSSKWKTFIFYPSM